MHPVTILLHANVLYAEYPLSDIPRIVETSYLPVLESIRKRDSLAVVLDFSGFTLEVLNGEHPRLYGGSRDVIDLPSNRCEQSFGAEIGIMPNIGEHEAAGSICHFHLALIKTALPE